MIAKITYGAGFRGALNYLLGEKLKEGLARDEEVARQEEYERNPEHDHGRELEREGASLVSEKEQGEERELAGRESAGRQVEQAEQREEQAGELQGLQHEIEADGPEYKEGERHRIIGGNMSGETARELAKEFGAVREIRPDIEKAVHHVSLTAAKGERLSAEQWRQIADGYAERMGFANSPYVVIQHRDTDYHHLHIVASRISLDGKVVNEWQSKQRAERYVRGVEREYGLEQVKPSHEVARAAPTKGEMEHYKRTGELSAKMTLQGHVEHALKDGPTTTEFIERLERVGVDVIPNLQNTGRMSGISFRVDGKVMKGSNLGRGFSWNALQGRGLGYEVERDTPALLAAKERELGRQAARSQEVARTPTEHFIEEANRRKQVEELERIKAAHPGPGKTAAREAFTEGHELLGRKASVEDLQRAAGIEMQGSNGADPLESLRRATGLESASNNKESIKRLELAVGYDREQEEAAAAAARERERQQEELRRQESERLAKQEEMRRAQEEKIHAPAVEKSQGRESKEQKIERGIDRGGYGYSR